MINMPSKFDVLAVYNAERYRGILHTESWELKMMKLQREYDDWLREQARREVLANALRTHNSGK